MWVNSFNFSNILRVKVYPPQFVAAETKGQRGKEITNLAYRKPGLEPTQTGPESMSAFFVLH